MIETKQLLDDCLGGHRLTPEEALHLLKTTGREIYPICHAADLLREEKVGNVVTYVRNQNIHITNVCKNLCGFCAFGKRKDDPDAFFDDPERIREKVRIACSRNITEICLLSGVHPDYTLDTYADIIRTVRDEAPMIDIHTASPDEVAFIAEKSGVPTTEALETLREAGLGTLQGTAAEILVDDVRKVICPAKVDTATWVRIIREAHQAGIRSTSTIMYGSAESPADRITHLQILREIQDETGGFTELVPLSYLHDNTELYRRGRAPAGATGREDLLMIAVSRLFLDNFDHIQVPWGKFGIKLTQIALLSGGDDLGGTMFSDDVSVEAGGSEAGYLDPVLMKHISEDIGRTLIQRTTKYAHL
ncbi:MAG: 7,8-didemethyl-8-hydroxy-5-deazariboflavin synthase subunit CofH [Methanocalculus sp. MSAO_Arc1]|uniref:5-amino-6-(D-ribitylamino)uracil--L-tyrosine 4-hydroxyphenyl transferase CofH n=1 Tax=Methanocalculus TaxID=71151 RepID=UPI000FF59409|nr:MULTISPECIES: 5-amino-6-(D-ribitylamino)uracil--L-tyrosine 4-hydroxyphenyl transferase CofH [unclassified Methanocalculus]MCP1661615.1 FO synthase subunit 2 [Methanocalculus sp. AMF5]RQD81304.1 MAG: 7,8-didemethyl-8-hydroxy-5-deazariboflavin synthase subunit CofH [Methanocalculus sp. MSAO_Arc1]